MSALSPHDYRTNFLEEPLKLAKIDLNSGVFTWKMLKFLRTNKTKLNVQDQASQRKILI